MAARVMEHDPLTQCDAHNVPWPVPEPLDLLCREDEHIRGHPETLDEAMGRGHALRECSLRASMRDHFRPPARTGPGVASGPGGCDWGQAPPA